MDAATDLENNNANLAGDGGVDDDLAPSHLSQDPDDDEVLEEGGCALSVRDVSELLHAQYAIITGGKSREGCPILTFPDKGNFAQLGDEEYRKLIIYLTSVPSLQDADMGFVLVIDRRNDKWNSVKTVLLKISGFFPGLITVAYVLRPAGFFQKAISEVSNKIFRDEFKFRCNSREAWATWPLTRRAGCEDVGHRSRGHLSAGPGGLAGGCGVPATLCRFGTHSRVVTLTHTSARTEDTHIHTRISTQTHDPGGTFHADRANTEQSVPSSPHCAGESTSPC
ncbi:uncharacterized protein LOC134772965 [Penaeus indicus]|uniref:uncharacterized protein LOC134772965 n=1 Tax=Penaeus indicus TaxID=29960 RepID=UPI00300CA85F